MKRSTQLVLVGLAVLAFGAGVWVWRARSPQGLLGYEVMLDHCHLHLLARPILLADLVPAVVQLAPAALEAR